MEAVEEEAVEEAAEPAAEPNAALLTSGASRGRQQKKSSARAAARAARPRALICAIESTTSASETDKADDRPAGASNGLLSVSLDSGLEPTAYSYAHRTHSTLCIRGDRRSERCVALSSHAALAWRRGGSRGAAAEAAGQCWPTVS